MLSDIIGSYYMHYRKMNEIFDQSIRKLLIDIKLYMIIQRENLTDMIYINDSGDFYYRPKIKGNFNTRIFYHDKNIKLHRGNYNHLLTRNIPIIFPHSPYIIYIRTDDDIQKYKYQKKIEKMYTKINNMRCMIHMKRKFCFDIAFKIFIYIYDHKDYSLIYRTLKNTKKANRKYIVNIL